MINKNNSLYLIRSYDMSVHLIFIYDLKIYIPNFTIYVLRSFDLVRVLVWNGADVINMSLGDPFNFYQVDNNKLPQKYSTWSQNGHWAVKRPRFRETHLSRWSQRSHLARFWTSLGGAAGTEMPRKNSKRVQIPKFVSKI